MNNFSSSVVSRFLEYIQYNTQSNEETTIYPSSVGQRELQKKLFQELKDLGIDNVVLDEHNCVYATIESNTDIDIPAIGFISHVDTSPDVSGANVCAKLHENYQCEDIILNESLKLTTEQSPELLQHRGDTIITSDGTTLLGADDKAGVAEIMAFVEYIQNHPEVLHGRIGIAFTCDEEIGRGTDYFDLKQFNCTYAYTVDGETVGEIENETFCAYDVTVTFIGVNVHPGTAKNKMKNAIKAASYFVSLFSEEYAPENTEGYQGYMHPHRIDGQVEKAEVKILLRDFQQQGIQFFLDKIKSYIEETKNKYGVEIVLDSQERYLNMRLVLDNTPCVVEYALEAVEKAGLSPRTQAIRGGTDGARLSFLGLPTPNIFTGGHLFHSKLEWIGVHSMEKVVETLVNLVQVYYENALDKK